MSTILELNDLGDHSFYNHRFLESREYFIISMDEKKFPKKFIS